MAGRKVRKHPPKSIGNSTPKPEANVPKAPPIVASDNIEEVVGCARTTATRGQQLSPKCPQTLNQAAQIEKHAESVDTASKAQDMTSTTPGQPQRPAAGTAVRSSAKSKTSTSKEADPVETCQKYLAGRCRNRNCPRIHPVSDSSVSVSESSSGPRQTKVVNDVSSSASRARHKAVKTVASNPSDATFAVPVRQPMSTSSVANMSRSDAPASHQIPNLSATNKLDISSVIHPPHASTSTSTPAPAAAIQSAGVKENKDGISRRVSPKASKGRRGRKVKEPQKLEPSVVGSTSLTPELSDGHKEVVLSPTVQSSASEGKSEEPSDTNAASNENIPAGNNTSSKEVCWDFLRRRCRRGGECRYYHPPRYEWINYMPKTDEPCIAFERGQCFLGERCWRYHPPEWADNTTISSDDDSDDDREEVPLAEAPITQRRGDEQSSGLASTSASAQQQEAHVQTVQTPRPSSPTLIFIRSHRLDDSSTPKVVCRNFFRDRCRNGIRCHRYHPPRYEWHEYIRSDEPCPDYEEGMCYLGENCYKYHPPKASNANVIDRSLPAKSLVENAGSAKPSSSIDTGALKTQGDRKSASDARGSSPYERIESSSPAATVNHSLDSSSPDSSPRVIADVAPSVGLTPTAVPVSHPVQPCWDFLQGKCHRVVCRFSHSLGDKHVERLVNLLKQSGKISGPPRVPVNGPSENKAHPSKDRLIPPVPPGLGLKEPHRAESPQSRRPEVLTVPVDVAQVTFGPGFEVKEVQTGFESRKVFLKNIPTSVDEKAIRDVLSPFGTVTEVQVPDIRPSATTMAVRAAFSSYTEAAQAVSALNGAHVFGVSIVVRLATHQSTAVGKGIVRDSDILLEFPAPCTVGYLGCSTAERADQIVARINDMTMCGVRLFAYRYEDIPKVGAFNVKVHGLPPDTKVKDLTRFGNDQGGMLGPTPNYKSLEDAAMDLQDLLETFGELITVDIQAPPYYRQTIRAWAHYTSPNAAESACGSLHNRRRFFLDGGRIMAYRVTSVTYKLPPEVFSVIRPDIVELRGRACSTRDHLDIVIPRHPPCDPTAPVIIKLLADTMPNLAKLKTAFEGILRGELVVDNGEPLWDPFFARAGGIAFTRELEQRYGMLINRDIRKRTIALFGTPGKRRAARAAILAKVQYVRSRQIHTFPIEGRLIGLFMSADLMKLQQQLGHENVIVDLSKRMLTVRGDEEALVITQDVLRKVQLRHVLERSKQGNECPVCFSEITLPVTLPCGHSWCKSCLASYFMASIDTRVFPLKCLGNEARCSQAISLQIALQVLSPKDYSNVARAAFLTYVHSRPKEFYYCPTPDCPQIYRGAPPDTVLQCPSCLVRICGNCHVEYHEGSFCPDRDADDRKLFENWTKNHDVKRCPGCKAPIERSAGCNHMTCTRCKAHICWACLATFSTSQDVYDHMHLTHGGID